MQHIKNLRYVIAAIAMVSVIAVGMYILAWFTLYHQTYNNLAQTGVLVVAVALAICLHRIIKLHTTTSLFTPQKKQG